MATHLVVRERRVLREGTSTRGEQLQGSSLPAPSGDSAHSGDESANILPESKDRLLCLGFSLSK